MYILKYPHTSFPGQPYGILDILRKVSSDSQPPEQMNNYNSFTLLSTIKMKEHATMLLVYKDPSNDDIFYQPVQGKQFCYR